MPNLASRTLVVWNNHSKIGELREFNNLWQFEYDAQWSEFDLCPQLPRESVLFIDGASIRPVQWFFDNGKLYAPDESYPSTHILKPDHPENNNDQHSVMNEWFVMSLAKQLGLNAPEVSMLHVPEPVYLIKRFDRIKTSGAIQRIHAIDACQTLSLDKAYKYQECSSDNLKKLIDLCRLRGEIRQRLFQWLLFNILVGNSDDHLKNLSFFLDVSRLTLTPHYDLLSTAVYANENGWGN